MEIEVIESPYLKSNMYVLSEDNHSIMIDPCENYQMKPGIRLDNILLTHEHYDHISGGKILQMLKLSAAFNAASILSIRKRTCHSILIHFIGCRHG